MALRRSNYCARSPHSELAPSPVSIVAPESFALSSLPLDRVAGSAAHPSVHPVSSDATFQCTIRNTYRTSKDSQWKPALDLALPLGYRQHTRFLSLEQIGPVECDVTGGRRLQTHHACASSMRLSSFGYTPLPSALSTTRIWHG